MTTTWGPLAEPPHDVTGPLDLPWRDNAWLSVMDIDNDVFGTVHVSTSPNAGARRAQCNFSVQGRQIAIAEPLESGTFTSKSINYDLAGLVEVDHPDLRMALRLTPRFQPADYTASEVFVPLDDKRPLTHFQQGADIDGEIITGETSTAVNGRGLRDRTWGFRQETAHITEYVSVMACFPNRDITVMKFDSPTGFRAHGFSISDVIVEASAMSVRRNLYSHYESGEIRFGQADETFQATRGLAAVGFAIGDGGPGPSLSIRDEFVALRDGSGQIGPAIIEQGILRRVC